MSLLSTFVASHLIPALEESFQANEPEFQAELLKELDLASSAIATWVRSKLDTKAE